MNKINDLIYDLDITRKAVDFANYLYNCTDSVKAIYNELYLSENTIDELDRNAGSIILLIMYLYMKSLGIKSITDDIKEACEICVGQPLDLDEYYNTSSKEIKNFVDDLIKEDK